MNTPQQGTGSSRTEQLKLSRSDFSFFYIFQPTDRWARSIDSAVMSHQGCIKYLVRTFWSNRFFDSFVFSPVNANFAVCE